MGGIKAGYSTTLIGFLSQLDTAVRERYIFQLPLNTLSMDFLHGNGVQGLGTYIKTYKYLYRIIATIITPPCLWLVFVGLASGNLVQAGVIALVCFLFIFGAIKAGRGNRRDIATSSAISVLIALPIAYKLYQRAVFAYANGGMEQADGYGSP